VNLKEFAKMILYHSIRIWKFLEYVLTQRTSNENYLRFFRLRIKLTAPTLAIMKIGYSITSGPVSAVFLTRFAAEGLNFGVIKFAFKTFAIIASFS